MLIRDLTTVKCDGVAVMHSVPFVDSHTAGEPTRVILEAPFDLGSGSLSERREVFAAQYHSYRRFGPKRSFLSGGRKVYPLAVPDDQNTAQLRGFKPASLNVLTQAVTSVVVIVFLVTLVMSFLGGNLVTRLTCLVLGAVLLGCWLFSVRVYLVDNKSICVQHPLWTDRFEVRGLAPEHRRPGSDSIRLFASNWVFGHTLGLCYNKRIGMFFAYVTNPQYKLDVETKHGVLVISPLDKAALASSLVQRY
jgi:hypothetical protein